MKLEKEYWSSCYSEPETMDGIANAKEHASYAKSLFSLEQVKLTSIMDLGCGTGHLLQAFCKAFAVKKASGIEPSKYMFKKTSSRLRDKKITLENLSLQQWCQQVGQNERWDLGICTSVFQYISNKDLDKIIPILSKHFNYLYLTVPTNKELDRQIQEMDFKDEYAIRRTRKKYLELICPHFTFVGSRILESKSLHSEKNSPFSEYLFRH